MCFFFKYLKMLQQLQKKQWKTTFRETYADEVDFGPDRNKFKFKMKPNNRQNCI